MSELRRTWEFVMDYYPNYDHCSGISESDDLQKIYDKEDEEDSSARKVLINKYGGNSDHPQIKIDLDVLHCDIFQRAILGFLDSQKKLVEIILADDNTGLYKIYEFSKDKKQIIGTHLFDGSLEECIDLVEQEESYILNNAQEVENDKVLIKKTNIRDIFLQKCSIIGMHIPKNLEEIVNFIFEEIHQQPWDSNDVMVGFRSWMESKEEFKD